MDRARIGRRSGRYRLVLGSQCVAQATHLTTQATATQNESEEVVLAGSRICQNPLDRVASLQTMSAADIDRSGAVASEIDLRYLTSNRVLMLGHGWRWMRGSSASGGSVFSILAPRSSSEPAR
jgi:iron complex outermembrane receptor protein